MIRLTTHFNFTIARHQILEYLQCDVFNRLYRVTAALVLTFLLTFFTIGMPAQFNRVTAAENPHIQKVAVLPFSVNSQNDMAYIKEGIADMLNSRLSWKNRVVTLSPHALTQALSVTMEGNGNGSNDASDAAATLPAALDGRILKRIASATGAQYIVHGSLTEFAKAYSLDAVVYNARNETTKHFFNQSNSLNQMITGVEFVAAQINKDVFNRKTEALERLQRNQANSGNVDGENPTPKTNIHANPETLMQEGAFESEKKRPFWKFWEEEEEEEDFSAIPQSDAAYGSNISSSAPDMSDQTGESGTVVLNPDLESEEEEEGKKKPFWKFW